MPGFSWQLYGQQRPSHACDRLVAGGYNRSGDHHRHCPDGSIGRSPRQQRSVARTIANGLTTRSPRPVGLPIRCLWSQAHPLPGAENVPLTSTLVVTFTDGLDLTSLVSASFALQGSQHGQYSGQFDFDTESNVLSFTPISPSTWARRCVWRSASICAANSRVQLAPIKLNFVPASTPIVAPPVSRRSTLACQARHRAAACGATPMVMAISICC